MPVRCAWSESGEEMTAYHDTEWGVPVHDDRRHFEYLLLDAFQAGLSWAIILRKRAAFRDAFAGFDPKRVAGYGESELQELLANRAIVRNRQKIRAAVYNAEAFLRVRCEFGSFDRYIWRFVEGKPRQNGWRQESEVPASTAESAAMSRDLRERGFRFVGPTICYAYMQAAGMVNDHVVNCFRHPEVGALGEGSSPSSTFKHTVSAPARQRQGA